MRIPYSIRWTLFFALLCAPSETALGQTPRKAPASGSSGDPPPAVTITRTTDPLADFLQQAKDSMDKDDYAAAVGPLQKYIAQRPDEAYPHFQLGFAYSELKRNPEAKTEFTRAVAIDPKMAPAQLNLGLVLLDTEPAAAADAFRKAAELLPTESRPKFLAGLALEHANKLPDAIEQYSAALALSPKDYEYRFAMGRAMLQSDKPAEAEDHFQQAIVARENSAPARLGLAHALLDQKKYDAAVEALAAYLKLNPSDHAARMDRAFVLLQLNRPDDVLAELDSADKLAPPTAESLKMRGNIYFNQQKWQEAAEPLEKALALTPKDPDLSAWLGHIGIELRDYPTAIAYLAQAYALNKTSPDILKDLANAFFLAEDYGSAIGAMDRLAGIETPQPASWFIRAICYDKLNNRAEAIGAYQKFLDQDNGKNESQELQARHRIPALQKELKDAPKSKQH
jgi:tetratricopeptide (TPR) repeat protein